MKFVSYIKDGKKDWGIKFHNGILSSSKILNNINEKVTCIMNIIEDEKLFNCIVENLPTLMNEEQLIHEQEIIFLPVVPRPSKIVCIGLNYKKHADETGMDYPKEPIVFNKLNNALTGHQAEISLPKHVGHFDYEGELTIVIGKKGKDIKESEALNYVFGYCNGNDVSERSTQFKTSQWLLGKTFDGFCPIGPYLVTKDEIKNPNQLKIETKVNGELRQSSNTADMIFSCETLISYLSKHMTLLPGDIILTGTPEGVIMGYEDDKRQWLKPNDEVCVAIEGLGELCNRLI